MKNLNKLRLAAGIPIDCSIEITEAREVPRRKEDLSPKDEKNMQAKLDGVESAIQNLHEALSALEAIPATDFMGDVPHWIHELEQLLNPPGSATGLEDYQEMLQKEMKTFMKVERKRKKAENEEMMTEGEVSLSAVEKTQKAVKAVISYLKQEASQERDHDLKELHKKDADKYTRILHQMTNDDMEGARHTWREMDTAARDLISNPRHVTSQACRKAAAKYLDFKLLHEGKKAAKDYDGDGKIESPEEEHKGVVDKKIKEKKGKKDEKVDESAKNEKDKKNKKAEDVMDKIDDTPEKKVMTDDKAHNKAGDDIEDVVVANPKKETKTTTESVHTYHDKYTDYEEDETKPVNVANGSSNADQVTDRAADPDNDKDESPTQLDKLGKTSMTDHDQKIVCPAKVKAEMKKVIAAAKKDADFVGSSTANKEAKIFYLDFATAMEKLLGHLEKNNINDFKKAQIFWSSLMGPMLHKVPAVASDFLVNGGKTRSLRDYMKPVDKKYPITGPRNTIK